MTKRSLQLTFAVVALVALAIGSVAAIVELRPNIRVYVENRTGAAVSGLEIAAPSGVVWQGSIEPGQRIKVDFVERADGVPELRLKDKPAPLAQGDYITVHIPSWQEFVLMPEGVVTHRDLSHR